MRTHLTAWLLGALLITSNTAWAAFSSIYVFGDSLSDNGTLADLAPLNYQLPYSHVPPDINRVSNGPLAVETLAERLGLPLNPSLYLTSVPAAGTNYAVAGATAGGIDPTDLGGQIDAFQANHGTVAPADALYVLFIGGNDVLDIRGETDDVLAASAISAATTVVDDALNSLLDWGAQSILVPNVIDIGLVPRVAADPLADPLLATQRSMEYNAALAATLAGVESNRGVNLFEYDLFGLSQEIAAAPSIWGLDNITDPCTDGNVFFPTYLGDCDATLINTYAYIDDIHPTVTVHNIIGDKFLGAIPVPAALPLFASGLLVLGIWSRRRR